MKKAKLKRDDEVIVMVGKDRGRRGKVLRVMPAKGTAIVEHLNMNKKHIRPNPAKGIAGGMTEREAPIHLSNLMLVDPERDIPTRIGRQRDAEGRPLRVAKKSGATLG
jgi:large subunit ribosomal protein L24